MKLLLDTCVLYPTVMREMLIGVARAGGFTPQWSERILAEWRHTAGRHGAGGLVQTEGEIALLRAAFPNSEITVNEAQMRRFWLPDRGDIHVLAAASLGGADGIVTLNTKDFPANILAEEGLERVNPDALLRDLLAAHPECVAPVAARVHAAANAMSAEASGREWSIRALMKKARLPRLGKALEARSD